MTEISARVTILRAGAQANGDVITPEAVAQFAKTLVGKGKFHYDEENHQITSIVSVGHVKDVDR